ncbi:MAG: hypothetical protein JNM80_08580 [Phycisphaerae bacterium]|nr:hypothetical protein [Phycisphaerae bacterium]
MLHSVCVPCRRCSIARVSAAALLLAAGSAVAQCPANWFLSAPGQPTNPNDPPLRQNHGTAFDAANGVLVLFGGFLSGTGFRGDTWTWDNESWTLRANTGPTPRGNFGMAYDSARSRVVLFGGAGVSGAVFGDTWEWDGGSWTQMTPTASPPGRFNSAMAFDSVRNVIVMTGGFSTLRHSDTWEYDGTTWTEMTGTTFGARSSHGMAFDKSRNRMVIFGGFNGARLADTRELVLPGGWQSVAVAGPSGRQYLGMDYDSHQDLVVLFGGQIGPAAADREQDTWVYNGTAWTRVGTTGPSKRDQHSMSYDSLNRKMIVFGGFQGTGFGGTAGDTWSTACPAGCYANCDGSTIPPVLNVNDFTCFLNEFAAGNSYANCDGSTTPPVLNVNDFTCFLNAFAAGCT